MVAVPKRICFVCLGNIVRSPLAEHLFRQLVAKAQASERYDTSSAGTGAWHVGEEPDARMREIASRHGLHYNGSARQFKPEFFSRYDLIIALDAENYQSVVNLAYNDAERAKVHLLRPFDPQSNGQQSVPDPYYDDLNGFETAYNTIARSCQGLFEALETGQL